MVSYQTEGKFLTVRKPHARLMGSILLNGMTCKDVAEQIGMSPQSFSRKMQRKSNFTDADIAAIGRVLGLSPEDYYPLFIKPADKKERRP